MPKIIKSDPPETTEILASSIITISNAFNRIVNDPNGLNRRGLIVLIYDACSNRVNKSDIEAVLDALPSLKGYYCRKK